MSDTWYQLPHPSLVPDDTSIGYLSYLFPIVSGIPALSNLNDLKQNSRRPTQITDRNPTHKWEPDSQVETQLTLFELPNTPSSTIWISLIKHADLNTSIYITHDEIAMLLDVQRGVSRRYKSSLGPHLRWYTFVEYGTSLSFLH
ncbi:pro-pol protein [Moniliophthora roreri]|nr:pro-pol protein [Moniliophthora roreri]